MHNIMRREMIFLCSTQNCKVANKTFQMVARLIIEVADRVSGHHSDLALGAVGVDLLLQ